jgi:hypothetical protein
MKHQTIRPYRKDNRNPTKGCRLYLYTGMRTKYCRKLKEVVCEKVDTIEIRELYLIVGSNSLNLSEGHIFARKDGFRDIGEFYKFFKYQYGLPFHGLLIEW